MGKPPVNEHVVLYKSFVDYNDWDDRQFKEIKTTGYWDGEKFVDLRGRKINPDGWRAINNTVA